MWPGSSAFRWILTRIWTHIDLAYFGRHPRYFLPPLSPSQPLIADGDMFFPDRSLDCFLFSSFFLSFFFFFVRCFWTWFFHAQHEGTSQVPIAKVSTYRRHSRTACTEQQSALCTTFVLTRVRQRKQSDKCKTGVAESHVRVFYVSYFRLCCYYLNHAFI